MNDSDEWPRVAASALRRPRLEERLSRPTPIIVLLSPVGTGKTTLLAQWASSHASVEHPVIWIRAGVEQSSREHLWRKAVDDLARHVELPTRDMEADGGAADRALWLFAHVRRPIVVVVDDYTAANDDRIDRDIVDIVQANPLVRFIVSSSVAGPLSSLRMAAQFDIVSICATDLLFTREEAMAAVTAIAGDAKPDDLYFSNVVFPLAARMIGVDLTRGQSVGFDLSGSRRAYIADSLWRELTAVVPNPDLIPFLRRISVASHVDVALAERLTGSGSGTGSLLDQAVEWGVGFWSSVEGKRTYVHVPMIRESLQRQQMQRESAELADLRCITAEWAAENGRPLRALQIAIEIPDLYLASRLARAEWIDLVFSHLRGVVPMLDAIHPRVIGRFPILSMLLAVGLDACGQRSRALVHFEAALRTSARQSGDQDPLERLWGLTVQTVASRMIGQYATAARAAEAAVEVAQSSALSGRAEFDSSFPPLLTQCGISLLYGGRPAGAMSTLQWVRELRTSNSPSDWFHATSLAAGIVAFNGDMWMTAELLDELDDQDWPDAWRLGRNGFLSHVARGLLFLERHELAQAQRSLDVAHALKPASEHWTYLVRAQAGLDIAAARPRAGLVRLEAALERAAGVPVAPVALEGVLRMRAFLLLSLQHNHAADAQLAQLTRRAPETMLLLGARALVRNEPESVLHGLSPFVARTVDSSNMRAAAAARLLCAFAAHDLELESAAVSMAEDAYATLNEAGLSTPLMLASVEQRLWLARVLRLDANQTGVPRGPAVEVFRHAKQRIALTKREQAVLRQLILTSSRDTIGERLDVSRNTVKTQLRGVYRKLGVKNRDEALLRAAELGLLEDLDG